MPKVMNTILITIFVFFATFCWVYYLTKLQNTALIGATILAFASACLCATKRLPKKTANKKIAKQLALQFALYGDNGVIADLYQYVGYKVAQSGNAVIATKNHQKCWVQIDFELKNTTCSKVVQACKVAKNNGCNRVDLWCNGVEGEVAKYVDSLPVKLQIFDANKTFALLDKYQKLPQLKIEKVVKNTPVLQYAFNKKRAKSYLTSSVFAFALSFLSFWPLYSLVWASLFALASLYSQFNKKFNLKDENIQL
jgi:hypothetical protein